MGRHPDRIALAKDFGATDVVRERGAEAVARIRELTGGFGAQSVLECVGTEQATETAILITRQGGAVGCVGVPQGEGIPASQPADILEGRIEPGKVFDRHVGLDGVPDSGHTLLRGGYAHNYVVIHSSCCGCDVCTRLT